MNFLKKLFHKKTDLEIETEIEQQVIQNNNSLKESTNAIIIKYVYNENTETPELKTICEFHNEMMPDINSIIWAPNDKKTLLIPYKVIRFDFIEDVQEDNIANNLIYIVVKDAAYKDILPE